MPVLVVLKILYTNHLTNKSRLLLFCKLPGLDDNFNNFFECVKILKELYQVLEPG